LPNRALFARLLLVMPEAKTVKDTMIDKLFSVGAHFGFSRSRRHPSVSSYLYGAKGGVELFDLEKTKVQFEEAKEFVAKLAKENKRILFVGSKKEAASLVRQTASNLLLPHVTGRWIGGTLTNFDEIKKRVNRLVTLRREKETGELSKYTKKERLLIDREIESLEEMFGGIVEMEHLPHALVVIDTKEEAIAVKEAHDLKIPVIALMGSDCNLKDATYPMLGNDASKHTVELFLKEISESYQKNKGVEKTEDKEEK